MLNAGLSTYALPSDSKHSVVETAFTRNFEELIAMAADQIYIVCVKCDEVTVPHDWLNKTTLVDGRKSDKCLDFEDESHWVKASGAHKIATAHALRRRYPTIAVFEEDFVLQDHPSWTDKAFRRLRGFVQAGKFDVIRLGTYPQQITCAADTAEKCECFEPAHVPSGGHICSVAPGCRDLHSSSGYILHSGVYRKVLQARGCIDIGALSVVTSTVFYPSLVHQPGWLQQERDEEVQYIKNCRRKAKPDDTL